MGPSPLILELSDSEGSVKIPILVLLLRHLHHYRAVVEIPSLEVFKHHVDMALGDMV